MLSVTKASFFVYSQIIFWLDSTPLSQWNIKFTEKCFCISLKGSQSHITYKRPQKIISILLSHKLNLNSNEKLIKTQSLFFTEFLCRDIFRMDHIDSLG